MLLVERNPANHTHTEPHQLEARTAINILPIACNMMCRFGKKKIMPGRTTTIAFGGSGSARSTAIRIAYIAFVILLGAINNNIGKYFAEILSFNGFVSFSFFFCVFQLRSKHICNQFILALEMQYYVSSSMSY